MKTLQDETDAVDGICVLIDRLCEESSCKRVAEVLHARRRAIKQAADAGEQLDPVYLEGLSADEEEEGDAHAD